MVDTARTESRDSRDAPSKREHGKRSVDAVVCGDLNLLRCFVGSEIETLTVASSPAAVTLSSRHCRQSHVLSAPAEGARLVAELAALGRALGSRPVLFYGTDAMLLSISRNRDVLDELFRFRMPPAELVEKLVDKIEFAELALREGLPVPATLSSREIAGPQQILERIGLPCVFKPSVHIGWFQARADHGLSPHKALRADTNSELERHYRELASHCPAFVVQRYVHGGEDCIYSYHAYLDADSKPLGEFAGKKIRTYPKHAGVSTFLELVKDDEVMRLGREISRHLGLVGPLKLDFKRDSVSGETYLLEVNARFTLWNRLGAVSGVNLPLIAHADLREEPPPEARDYRTDVRWLSFGNDLRSYFREYRLDGELGFGAWVGSLVGPTVYDVFAWDDPLPFAMNALQFSKAFLRRKLGRERLAS